MQKCTKWIRNHVKSKMEEKCCSKELKNTHIGKKSQKQTGGQGEAKPNQNPISQNSTANRSSMRLSLSHIEIYLNFPLT